MCTPYILSINVDFPRGRPRVGRPVVEKNPQILAKSRFGPSQELALQEDVIVVFRSVGAELVERNWRVVHGEEAHDTTRSHHAVSHHRPLGCTCRHGPVRPWGPGLSTCVSKINRQPKQAPQRVRKHPGQQPAGGRRLSTLTRARRGCCRDSDGGDRFVAVETKVLNPNGNKALRTKGFASVKVHARKYAEIFELSRRKPEGSVTGMYWTNIRRGSMAGLGIDSMPLICRPPWPRDRRGFGVERNSGDVLFDQQLVERLVGVVRRREPEDRFGIDSWIPTAQEGVKSQALPQEIAAALNILRQCSVQVGGPSVNSQG